MNRPRAGLTILAHFPDVSESAKTQSPTDEASGGSLFESGKRWIGQAAAARLLAGVTLFMIVGAILPIYLKHKAPSADPASQNSPFATCPSAGQGTSTSANPAARRPAR